MVCKNIARAGGIPALAYVKSDSSLHLPCSLVLRYSEPDKQATISLQFSFPLLSSDGQAVYTLLYDADNLVPGAICLEPAIDRFPSALLVPVAQGGNPDFRTLSLKTKKACMIWCSGSLESIAQNQDKDGSFHRFLTLARLSDIQILFDHKWIPTQNHMFLGEIIDHPERLNGVPVDIIFKHGRRYSLSEYRSRDPVGDEVSELPPPYTSRLTDKRPRQTSSTNVSSSPKRARRSPANSPTEKASTASAPSPKDAFSLVTYTYASQDAGSPTEKASTASTPSHKAAFSPVARTPASQDVVTKALGTVLGDFFANLPIDPPSTPASPSSPSLDRHQNRGANLNIRPRSPSRFYPALRALLSAHGASHAEAHLEKIYDSAVLYAEDLYNRTEIDISEYVDDLKIDLEMLKDDGIVDLNDAVHASLAKLKEEIDAYEEEVLARIETRLDELQQESVSTSKHGVSCEAKREESEWRTEVREEEAQMRARAEACERERDIAQRESDVSNREKELCKRETRLYKREGRLCKRERRLCKGERRLCKGERRLCKGERKLCKRERRLAETREDQGKGR